MMKHILIAAILLATCSFAFAIKDNRWKMVQDGSICWKANAQGIPHYDDIEMSGRQVSVVLRYGINEEGAFVANKGIVWPLLRTIPNNTHASLMRQISWNPLNQVTVNHRPISNEKVDEILIKGMVTVKSTFMEGRATLIREYFPSAYNPALLERYAIINKSRQPIYAEIPDSKSVISTDAKKGIDGSYRIEMAIDTKGSYYIQPGDTLRFSAHIAGYKEDQPTIAFNADTEKVERLALIASWTNNLVLETPDSVINRMFAFSKIRACESIYETKGGPMHGPGGESFYAAIWANDQAEYINPYFPFTGYEYGCQSAINSFRHFARFINDHWNPIPSSIIAEGTDIWNGAGDRGDGAMIAYGAARYALARGSREEAMQLWPLISWCLEYCNQKLTPEGVVASDSDELEGRFPSGMANLCTSSLYYDALISAAYLAKDLGFKKSIAEDYSSRAKLLRKAIENYFGNKVEGFDTYSYYKGNDILRSWICMPLTVGIHERAQATISALFSPRLWSENGLLTQAGDKTYWDRSTLYAIRGIYTTGETHKATDFLQHYSSMRLLGEHVPYAIEAWPEGGKRHLSAESGLYGRVITEGLLGIRPTGLKSFDITPHLPKEWNFMKLKQIKAFNSAFDIEVERLDSTYLQVKIISGSIVRTYKTAVNKPLSINII